MSTSPHATSGIVATAFDLMEQSAPSTLADDSDKAEAANRNYFRSLKALLAKAQWSFAREIVTLNDIDEEASGISVDLMLPHAFTIPDGVLRIWTVGDSVVWRRDKGLIRCDQVGPHLALATVEIEDETKLPEEFQLAVAHHLAVLLAPKFISSLSKKRQLKQDAADALAAALDADAISGTPERYDLLPEQPDWVDEALR